jgi:lysophospholipase L1-like esterase
MRIAFWGDSLTEGFPGCSYLAMLAEQLPEHTLINRGRGGDTVKSLYRRLARSRPEESYDLAFLWVGVNDVAAANALLFRVAKTCLRQPPARDMAEFRSYYQASLDTLCRRAQRVITVSPLLKGEDARGAANVRIGALADVIAEIAAGCAQAEYLDVRSVIIEALSQQRISPYGPSKPLRAGLDILTLRTDQKIDRAAARRGLHYTLDGLHLNSAGARIVSRMLLQRITAQCGQPAR